MSPKSSPQKAATPVPFRVGVVLLVLGVAASVLSVFQWSQLLTLRAGGSTVCGVSDTVNCETVWNSPFATRLHELFGIPVAGLGLVWGLTVVALSALYLARARSGKPVAPAAQGLKLTAGAGIASVLVFAFASFQTGVVCPTCLGTYALVAAIAAVAWKGLPAAGAGQWVPALQWTVGVTVAVFIAVLLPGRSLSSPQPKAGSLLPVASSSTTTQAATPASLEAYLRGLPMEQQQFISNALALYRRDVPKAAAAPARHRYGPVDAPVKIVEWTDSKCPHCKALVEELAVLKKRVPEGKLSLEARQFPLDGSCNPAMPKRGPDAPSVRCVAAKAQICLEGAPDFWELREKLFAAQAVLDTERVMEIASSGSMSRMQLDACISSAATAAKIQEDTSYALRYQFTGTPLVVVNGRQAMPSAPFLYALVMADGNPSAPAFDVLPPPRAMPQDDHAGHNH
ncbi:thioredoxin domain-containing protein [Myxococcus sp. CA051A]|uniref:vitamin K epoxide reductase/DsbA family protein n=1 Tax=unclassified Myxococcus TaxID=2648731 RepID=UPI00157B6350|nr:MULTISPECIES: thioredoxin domain-containing protein [unclassified Myxococcus]NTX03457.1 thioredoxin domain-containing protein [Myxococcus sp. CA040A]NTX34035.1 thioredoxin domain-containing protein [Myxococcus sp. CA033]NTX58425.1 thioredoxin domain-containing protein [Myxococcus sp. CA039A]NTX65778.1 thioredoxin domain-containing protein [Myxococcus sp. CA051A]